MQWFDAHLDLAMLPLLGRRMLEDPAAAGGPWEPGAVTLPSLREGGGGGVTHALATIFTEADGDDEAIAYRAGDAEGAHRKGVAQLDVYRAWIAEGYAAPWHNQAHAPLRLGILIEGADPVRSPAELPWWRDAGVVAIGLAWWKGSRYAGGNGSDPADERAGLTPLGREMVREMDRLGLVHDVSHLSDRALAELFSTARGRVIASHSNCRALVGDPANQRHLTDETIREITRRGGGGGVIGLNLLSKFITANGAGGRPEDTGPRATVAQFIEHIERVCELAGDRKHVGLGSDMDGGFAATRMPEGIDRPRDLVVIAEALRARGWTEGEVRDFAFGNWARFWGVDR